MDRCASPVVIQGGMGVGVSDWRLARAVAQLGQLGVVSGTALDAILARRLQNGDPGNHIQRALDDFPFPKIAKRVLTRYYIPGGKPTDAPYRSVPMTSLPLTQDQLELILVGNFVEVYLAKEDHPGPIGVNYLEKIQLPILPALLGAMLAKVDYVLMGAGIPRHVPGVLDRFAEGKAAELPVTVTGDGRDDHVPQRLDPRDVFEGDPPWLERPRFLPIVSSATLATMLARKANGQVDGFIVEGPTAGGHNAPPRGALQLNSRGEPIYGRRDVVDLEAMKSLQLPFWLAGSYGSPEQVLRALQSGAAGVQVGTAFAFCDESGLHPEIKREVIRRVKQHDLAVFTDPVASPTGFPFKVLSLDNTLSEPATYEERDRVCDLGYLRQAFRQPDGSLIWRCPAEDVEAFVRKGGSPEDAAGRKCLCNGLMANIDLAQRRHDGQLELPLVTCGDDVTAIEQFLPNKDADHYSARDVILRLISKVRANQPSTALVIG
jgi:nitronate monooxygenase